MDDLGGETHKNRTCYTLEVDHSEWKLTLKAMDGLEDVVSPGFHFQGPVGKISGGICC